ncbi:DNA polymerase III subunit theta [Pantoea endophytica]
MEDGVNSHNLAARSREERDCVNVDLAASGVAYKERMNMSFVPHEAEMQQPADLREYFKERLQHYRNVALQFPRGSDPVYQKDANK